MHVGTQVVDPQLFGPGGLLGGLGVEEQHVGLHALRIENPGGQTQTACARRTGAEVAANRLARATLEQHVVRHDDCRTAIDLQQRLDVLHEVELLVLGRGPEVRALVGVVFLFQFALFIDDGDSCSSCRTAGWSEPA